mmetsp:Transcript_68773/g.136290  ORF Transcript_68773/g.136290 Transcript_68773/m.136290 type:complete len:160 (-) Transcript_68773:130-609(-)
MRFSPAMMNNIRTALLALLLASSTDGALVSRHIRRAPPRSRSSLMRALPAPPKARDLSAYQIKSEMSTPGPMIIDVYARHCGPCRLVAPHVEALAHTLGDRARVVKVDCDMYSQLSSELQVHGLPTLLFLREGKEVHRLEGLPSTPDVLEALAHEHLCV